jgi:hypothetical protein
MRVENIWQERYKAAVLETDEKKLHKRIQAAKAAIDARLHELRSDHGETPDERQAINDALAGLNVLRRETKTRSHDTGLQRLMFCEEKSRLLDAFVTVTDRQAKAVKSLHDAAKDNRTAFREAMVHAEQTRQDAEVSWLSGKWRSGVLR